MMLEKQTNVKIAKNTIKTPPNKMLKRTATVCDSLYFGKKITPLCSDASNLYKQPFGWVCNILTINGVVLLCKVVFKMKSEVFAWLISLIGVVLFCFWAKKEHPTVFLMML